MTVLRQWLALACREIADRLDPPEIIEAEPMQWSMTCYRCGESVDLDEVHACIPPLGLFHESQNAYPGRWS